MKTAIKTLLISMTMVGLGTGCDASDIARFFDQLGTGVGNPGDVTNDLPEPGDEPTNDLPCITLLGHDCDEPGATEPGHPGDDCVIALDDCLIAQNGDPACFEAYDDCAVWDDPCSFAYEHCLLDLGPNEDPARCDAVWDDCVFLPPPPPPPGLCEQMHDLCLIGGVDPVLCDEALAQCSEPEPPPCDGEPSEPPYPGDPGVNGSN